LPESDRYVSVDVETAGPNPGQYSLLSVGACLVSDPQQGFYAELKPLNDLMTPDAFAVHGLKLEDLSRRGQPPEEALERFDAWLAQALSGSKPIFVGFNAPFDWMFVSDYFYRYLGRNPFGHSALDIKAYYMGRFGVSWAETSLDMISSRFMGGRILSHNALQDARDQAEIFRQILSPD
jgi:DNA polymerase III epsilon subunit-like protein